MQGRTAELHMKNEGLEMSNVVGKIGPTSFRKKSIRKNITAYKPAIEKNGECVIVNSRLSFPMGSMKRIAEQTVMKACTIELQIPGIAERLDRVNLVKNHSRNILGKTSRA